MHMLKELRPMCVEPDKIDALIEVINNDLGYYLYRAVERTKRELSVGEESQFVFDHDDVHIASLVKRSDFEMWISDDLARIDRCVADALARSSVEADQVERVFLTGGSSFVPAVRRLFERRFGSGRIQMGDEMTSVAAGLSLYARDIACEAP